MTREEAFTLVALLQKARREMCVVESLAFVRAAVVGGRQQPFVYDVLALLEEAAEVEADYDKFKGLITTAISFVNKSLSGEF
jgi:hypothetical protein